MNFAPESLFVNRFEKKRLVVVLHRFFYGASGHNHKIWYC